MSSKWFVPGSPIWHVSLMWWKMMMPVRVPLGQWSFQNSKCVFHSFTHSLRQANFDHLLSFALSDRCVQPLVHWFVYVSMYVCVCVTGQCHSSIGLVSIGLTHNHYSQSPNERTKLDSRLVPLMSMSHVASPLKPPSLIHSFIHSFDSFWYSWCNSLI